MSVPCLILLAATGLGSATILSRGVPLGTAGAPDDVIVPFEVRLTSGGYIDVVIDTRPGFVGREYLSGEWAPAIAYAGHMPMWLSRWHVFPDYPTNSDLDVFDRDGEVVLRDGDPVSVFEEHMTEVWPHPDQPLNKDGFLVMQSQLRNEHVEITHRYEFCHAPGGMAQGLGAGQNGEVIQSNEFAYVHTLSFRNISDEPLEDFRYYHLIHSLNADYAVYDEADHGGFMSEYRHDFTQRALSYSVGSEDGAVYRNTDYVTVHSKVAPDAYEVGHYGVRGTDSHEVGKPGSGVHLSIEQDQFSGLAEFSAEETGGWVAGAARYPLGTIGVGETIDFSLVLSLVTMSELVYPDTGIRVEDPVIDGEHVRIVFHDTHDLFNEANLFFGIESSISMRMGTWNPLPLPFLFNPQEPGRFSFEVPYDSAVPQDHFRITLVPGF